MVEELNDSSTRQKGIGRLIAVAIVLIGLLIIFK